MASKVRDGWTVTDGGIEHGLRIGALGLELSGPNGRLIEWSTIRDLSYPTNFSVKIEFEHDQESTLHLGFRTGVEQHEFREAVHEQLRAQGVETSPGPSASLPALARAVHLSTLADVPGMKVSGSLGLITVTTVMSRNLFSDFGSDFKSGFGGRLGGIEKVIDSALEETRRKLQRAAATRGANAVVGIFVAVETVADKAQAIVMSGTSVTVESSAMTADESGATASR